MVDLNLTPGECTIGWIGFGKMGAAAAGKHVEHKYRVVGYNRTIDKVKSVSGVEVCKSIQDVIQQSDIIFSSLAEDTAVKAVYAEIIKHIKPGMICVDMSTVHPDTVIEINKQLQGKHCELIDAPISGSPVSIEKNSASIIAGGDSTTYEKVRPLIALIGPSSQTLMGPVGCGQVSKLSINLHLAAQVALSCESVLLCTSYGIPKETALQALLSSAAASGHMKYRAPYINKMPQTALFTTAMCNKDLRLVADLANRHKLPLPVTSASHQMIIATDGAGYADQDFAGMYQAFYEQYEKST